MSYIAYDQWLGFKAGALQSAYMAGRDDFIDQFIVGVENTNCDSIHVSSKEKQVYVININCLITDN